MVLVLSKPRAVAWLVGDLSTTDDPTRLAMASLDLPGVTEQALGVLGLVLVVVGHDDRLVLAPRPARSRSLLPVLLPLVAIAGLAAGDDGGGHRGQHRRRAPG